MSQYYYNPFPVDNNTNVNTNNAVREYMDRKRNEKKEIRFISFTMGCAIILFLVIQLMFSAVLEAFGLMQLYCKNVLFYHSSNIILSVMSIALPFGIMALINRKKYTESLIPNDSISFGRGVAWTFFGTMCCVISNLVVVIVSTLSENIFGYELTQGEKMEMLPDSFLSAALELLALAVVPAICEEFAMRCCSLQLLRKYGSGFAVFAVSIVFGLLHGNIVQFIFAFLVGIILAAVTVKTGNILPAVFIHFLNNGMSAVQDIVKAFSGEKAGDSVILIFYILYFIAGAASLIYLIKKKELRSSGKGKAKAASGVLSNGEKFVAFIFPWMVVPFIVLILLTATTIKKV